MIILFNRKLTYLLLIGLLLTILSINVSISKADTSIEWNKTYGGVGDDIANCMIKTNDGNYVIVGSTTSFGAGGSDFWLIKIDENGNLLWNKTYGATGTATCVIQTSDDGYALVGYTDWLLKLDSSGNLQWNQTLKSTYAGVRSLDSIVQTNDGGYVVLGTSEGGPRARYLIKTDSSGNQLWDTTLTQNTKTSIGAMIHTNDGFGLLSTYAYNVGYYDLTFSIYDSNGTGIGRFSGRFGLPGAGMASSRGIAAVQTNDGGYTVLGTASGPRGDSLWFIKLDSTGHEIWNTTLAAPISSIFIQTSDTGYAFAGSSGGNFWLDKTDSYGNLLWNKTFGGVGTEVAKSIVETVDGGFLLAGSTNSFGAGGYDFWVVKITSPLPLTTLTVLNTENGTMYPSPGTYIPSDLGDNAAWLIAHPDLGYKFSHFLINGIQTSAQYIEPDGDYTYYLNMDTSHVVEAVFTVGNPVFSTLTVYDSLGGRLYPYPGMYLSSDIGDSTWLIAHPDTGYSFSHFLIDGKITPPQYLEDDGDYTYYLTMDTSHTVQAVFTVGLPIFSTLTILDSVGGQIYPSPGNYLPSELGDDAAWLIAHPNVGYKFNYFLIDGVVTSNQYLEEDGDYTYYLKTDTSHSVQAIFTSSYATETYDFTLKWGSTGSGNGQFEFPTGIAIDGSGNVYVADHFNHRIQKFTSNGIYLTQWGSYGSGDGQFNRPWGIAIDSSGNVYVADHYNNRIQEFTNEGVFIKKWGTYGSSDGQMYYPACLAFDASGNIYVTEKFNHRVQKFSSDCTFLAKWGSYGSGNGQFKYPTAIALDSLGNVYVVDEENHRIQKFTSNGIYLTQWGSYGSGDGQFRTPVGVATDSLGNIYVTDRDNYRIQEFTSDGVFVTKWGSQGSGDGQFNDPARSAFDRSGYFYICDGGNDRIQKFAPANTTPST